MAKHKHKKHPYAISDAEFGSSYGGLAGNMMGGSYAKNPFTKHARSTPGSLAYKPPPGIPLDPAAEQDKISAGRNLAVGNLGGALNKGYLAYDTGYGATGARDFSNPYSKASLLQESFKRNQRGTTNSYAAQGQLYSGAYGRAQNENSRNYSIDSNALRTAASRGYTGINLGLLQNAATYGTSLSDADWAALVAALGGGS